MLEISLAGAVGIEPTPKVLETFVLPLNYAPMKFSVWITVLRSRFA
jgi:hypothetical protein